MSKQVIIQAQELSKSFNKGEMKVDILSKMSVDVYKNDFTVIMGRSGAGKSTLLYCLSMMDESSSGSIKIMDREITKMSEGEKGKLRTNQLAFIFQSINLLPDLTIFENVAFVGYRGATSKHEVHKKTEDLLKKFEIWDQRDKYPAQVSGGQQQRTAIARALINEQEIIFGDEPTGALNSTTAENVLDILTELNEKGKTIVIVTHDIKVATRATRLLYLSDGKIGAELELGKFNEEDKREREDKVIAFLRKQGW